MPTTCDIELQNNSSNIVYAGQELCGTVRLTLTEEKHLRGVYIEIYGKGYCCWTVGKTTFVNRANYLNEIIYFIGSENDNVRLAPNTYTYHFRCHLPSQLPTSLQGKFGYIRYSARVVLASFSIFPDKKFKQQFSVIRALNLNDYTTLQQPIVVKGSYQCGFNDFLCCCFCWICYLSTRQLEIFATIPVSGYAPGQTIHMEIHMKNLSSESSESNCKLDIKLIKHIHYFSREVTVFCCNPPQHEKKEKQTMLKKSVSIRFGSLNNIINIDLLVPPIPPTDIASNNIMNVTYYLRISVSIGFCEPERVIKIPLTIGTVPIQSVEPNSGPLVSSAPPQNLVFGHFGDSELPSYAEATAN